MSVKAVIFDMDGVIVESERAWHEVRRDYAAGFGRTWTEDDQRANMGNNSWQWAHYMRTRLGVPRPERAIIADVLALVIARPYLLAIASSAPPGLIRWVIHTCGLGGCLSAWVSCDDVACGKPAPDVYMKACERLGVARSEAVAVEDSSNGMRAAKAAGLALVAVPNRSFPPAAEALALADIVLASVADLTPDVLRALGAGEGAA